MKIGDRVNVKDRSYGFGIWDGEFIIHTYNRKNLIVVKTGLFVMKNANGETRGGYREQNDLLVTDGKGNFWFTQSRFCELVGKKIEAKYFCDGVDVTDSISDETKRGVSSIAR